MSDTHCVYFLRVGSGVSYCLSCPRVRRHRASINLNWHEFIRQTAPPIALLLTGMLAGCHAVMPTVKPFELTWTRDVGLQQPVGIAPHPRGGVLVADSGNNRVVWINDTGDVRATWGGEGDHLGQFQRPLGVAAGSDGRIYVADYLNDRVQVLAASDESEGKWSSFGDDVGFMGPADVTVDQDGLVYVVEFNGGRVVKLDSSGRLLKTWGEQGHGLKEFYYPTRITTGPDGNLWVTDAYNHRLKVYDPEGNLLYIIGSEGDAKGQFNVPGGVAFDAQGRVWIADFFNNRLQRFTVSINGQPEDAMVWTGSETDNDRLQKPTDLNIDLRTGELYVVDYGNNRLLKLQPTTNKDQPLQKADGH